jgi:hypothetical protein
MFEGGLIDHVAGAVTPAVRLRKRRRCQQDAEHSAYEKLFHREFSFSFISDGTKMGKRRWNRLSGIAVLRSPLLRTTQGIHAQIECAYTQP